MKSALNAGVAAMAVALAWSVTPALAAEADAENIAPGDIIVTAQKREQALVDVPISLSAFNNEALENNQISELRDFVGQVPNLFVNNFNGRSDTVRLFIRGVGQQDPVSGFEQGVGIYVDDVYLNRPQAAVLDIYDVERIEVLRGPQGTLYGRNTIGGAVKYVTKRLPQEASVAIRGTVGTYGQADGVITASAPIAGSWAPRWPPRASAPTAPTSRSASGSRRCTAPRATSSSARSAPPSPTRGPTPAASPRERSVATAAG